jgi:hypothetical protein
MTDDQHVSSPAITERLLSPNMSLKKPMWLGSPRMMPGMQVADPSG